MTVINDRLSQFIASGLLRHIIAKQHFKKTTSSLVLYDATDSQGDMKFSRAISRVNWSSGEDEDRDGLRNVGFLTAQPFDPADIPRKLHHTQSPGKQQISYYCYYSDALSV